MDLSPFVAQVGQRTSSATARLDARAAELYRGTFDPLLQPLPPGAPLPPGWHGLYFHAHPPRSALRPDGSAAGGGAVPDIPLPLRVFASERTWHHDTLRLGDTCTQQASLAAVHDASSGRGPLVLVSVRERIVGPRGLAVETERTTAFLGTGRAPVVPPAAPGRCTWSQESRIDALDLFRFSAATRNDHRAHYDHDWATREEGHRALLVHGPLSALLLLDFARRHADVQHLRHHAVRAVAPLYVDEPVRLLGEPAAQGIDLWLEGPRGVVMQAWMRAAPD